MGIVHLRTILLITIAIGGVFFLSGCRPAVGSASSAAPNPVERVELVVEVVPTPAQKIEPLNTPTPNPTSTKTPTLAPTMEGSLETLVPPIFPTATPIRPTPSPSPPPICTDRIPSPDDLLIVVSKQYGLSRHYIPPDLVPLSDFFPFEITLGYPTLVRRLIIPPLQKLIAEMQAVGLEPQLISGYRDFHTQALAYQKWEAKFPDRADQLSAPPGHSEHQLGTTVDFGSPKLPDYIQEEELKNQQFHTHFYMTPEGQWLIENAHLYGFTLSYPREAIELTGFFYEPWHFRYVGIETATILKEQKIALIEYQLQLEPDPCQT